ncbi:BBP7 family outer membrane beta-barrel protein [Adhaeretor mobilis]|uniref:Uncharacterized protein n=1 Tax=Adhaeretor mobilis TaxID=1930276 RepID=A0A517MVM6_9BACT|nr:BBP7 family outer membrane beta-barrel protein [Adhaeretor mobilis]QDS98936.1 hypothetical protein HG15A2_22240 [Adhaeretor mobilis]
MMKRSTLLLTGAALLVFSTTTVAHGQRPGQPSTMGYGPGQGPQVPMMAASPLAGGPNAAVGSQFVDAHGKPIILQTNYCQGGDCYGGGGGYGDGAPCGPGMGDGVYADFGGYGEDQIGPHYFDFSVDAIFLLPEERFNNAPALTAVGIGPASPRLNSLNQMSTDYEPGFRVAGRLDLGPLSVFEATYMGLEDIAVSNRLVSTDITLALLGVSTPDFLFTPASADASAVLIPELDAAEVHTVDYQSELHSTELSYRRYWVGYRPRFSGTYLLGFRYVRTTEDLAFTASGTTAGGQVTWESENDLVGAQAGGDMWIGLRQGLRFGIDSKAGIYNNRYKFNNATNFGGGSTTSEGNQVAFVGDLSAQLVADIWPSVSLKTGYQVLYMSSLVNVANNIDSVDLITNSVNTQGDALYHGFNAGIEYVW